MAAVAEVNGLYRAAPDLEAVGEQTVSSNEMTGMQALERKHSGLPPVLGRVERLMMYVRMPWRTYIISRDVATGQVVARSVGPPRPEADFVVDNLNTH